jgi:hypothetical protein
MRAHHAFAIVIAVGLAAGVSSGVLAIEPQVSDERIVSQDRLAQDVVVRGVEADGGTVSGTVVNNSGKVLRDVQLMIRRSWLWDDEFHPGTNDPSRTEFYTLRQEIPPGGQLPFTYRSESPLAEGRGGHFVTDVKVASVVQFPAGTGATAGATAAPPSSPPPDPYRAPAAPAERPPQGY